MRWALRPSVLRALTVAREPVAVEPVAPDLSAVYAIFASGVLLLLLDILRHPDIAWPWKLNATARAARGSRRADARDDASGTAYVPTEGFEVSETMRFQGLD